ncbi:hypothetical protein [Anaeromyxobacter terrae]|uniref:hypothetical protein n=1 Tax=Anaeromyxobacter terrae TaxID=2925406 RepID=UPI001F5A7085|nr:hypothetical protein [Anaeromyxobacter sp. SG22]
MSRTFLVVAALAAIPVVSRPEPPLAEGSIDAGDAQVEVLGRRYAPGETIELPEGYLRVEEAGPEDDEIGSFSVVPAAALARAEAPAAATAERHAPRTGASEQPSSVTVTGMGAGEEAPAPWRSAHPDCSAERAAYLAEIWKQSGIEVSDPQGFLAGLEQTEEGADLTLAWFALSTDAFRTLAWSSDARAKAAALARCARGN